MTEVVLGGHRYALYFRHLAGRNTLLTSVMWHFYQAVKKTMREYFFKPDTCPRLPRSRYQSHIGMVDPENWVQ